MCKKKSLGFVCFALLQLVFVVNSEDLSNRGKGGVTPTSSYPTSNGTFRGKPCDANNLEECWANAKLPTINGNEPKIPTTSKEVEVACHAFKIGMDCVNEYSSQCLNSKQRQQLNLSVRGAHQTFSFLCTDAKFRQEFLTHSKCFAKISRSWDGCAAHFIEALKRVDQKQSLAVCCIRLRFLECVREVAQLHCNKEAVSFLIKMAETLVSSKVRKNETECLVTSANCSSSSGAWSLKSSSLIAAVFNMVRIPSFKSFMQFLSAKPLVKFLGSGECVVEEVGSGGG